MENRNLFYAKIVPVFVWTSTTLFFVHMVAAIRLIILWDSVERVMTKHIQTLPTMSILSISITKD